MKDPLSSNPVNHPLPLVRRLRDWAADTGYCAPAAYEAEWLREAADEIERLTAELARWKANCTGRHGSQVACGAADETNDGHKEALRLRAALFSLRGNLLTANIRWSGDANRMIDFVDEVLSGVCEDCGQAGGHQPNCGREPTYDNQEI